MIERQRRIERIRSVEREYRAGLAAAEFLTDALMDNPSLGERGDWKYGDARSFKQNLAPTFVIRLFAEFEAGLRDYWEKALKRKSKPAMQKLVDAIATVRTIPWKETAEVHEARELRNSYVHE